MKQRRPTNPACRKLAEHLYPRESPMALAELANQFQDVADDFPYTRGERRITDRNRAVGGERAPLTPGNVDALVRLRRRVRLAEIAYARALVDVFPINSRAVYLMRGRHAIECTILGHRDDRVKIRSSSGVEQYVLGDHMRAMDPVPASKGRARA